MTSQRLGEFKSSGIVNINNQPAVGGLSVKYGDFGQADPEMTKILPSSVNLGLTSPGFLDNASDCTGVDFINNNPPYDSVTFKQCLEKFQDQFQIPEQGLASLIRNLPYTFNSMNKKNQEYYISELKNFIKKVDKEPTKVEKFNNNNNNVERFTSSHKEDNLDCKKIPNYNVNIILVIIIIMLLCPYAYILVNWLVPE